MAKIVILTIYMNAVQLGSKVTVAIWNVCETLLERTRNTYVQAQNLTIKLQQDLCNCHAFFARYGTHVRRVQKVCRTSLEHLQEVSQQTLSWSWAVPYVACLCTNFTSMVIGKIFSHQVSIKAISWSLPLIPQLFHSVLILQTRFFGIYIYINNLVTWI